MRVFWSRGFGIGTGKGSSSWRLEALVDAVVDGLQLGRQLLADGVVNAVLEGGDGVGHALDLVFGGAARADGLAEVEAVLHQDLGGLGHQRHELQPGQREAGTAL